MLVYPGHPMVVQTGPSQRLIAQLETKRVDQMQLGPDVGNQPNHIPGVRGDLRLIEHDMEVTAHILLPVAATSLVITDGLFHR
jgi:hypothetical protein